MTDVLQTLSDRLRRRFPQRPVSSCGVRKPAALFMTAVMMIGLAACADTAMRPGAILDSGVSPADGSAEFRVQDFSWSKAPGRAGIQGLVDYRTRRAAYGCQGKDVVLLPETAWSRNRVMMLYGALEAAAVPIDTVRSRTIPAPADYALVVRHATCDQASRFVFSNLPAGRWFAITLASPPTGAGSAVVVMRRIETGRSVQQVVLGGPT